MVETDRVVRNLASQDERERALDDMRVAEARDFTYRLTAMAQEHEQRAHAAMVLSDQIREHLAASARGHLPSEEPQAAPAPEYAMKSPGRG